MIEARLPVHAAAPCCSTRSRRWTTSAASCGSREGRLASANPHKLEELAAALPGWELELLGDVDFPPEDGETYVDNARIKARFGRGLVAGDAWVLGEDSGIEAAGLGGRPGVHSARFAAGDPVGGCWRSWTASRSAERATSASWSALAADGTERRGTGTLEGRIAAEPRGSEGFGYDPIFVPSGEERTVAELATRGSGTNSHRARAAQALGAASRARPSPGASSTSSRPARARTEPPVELRAERITFAITYSQTSSSGGRRTLQRDHLFVSRR